MTRKTSGPSARKKRGAAVAAIALSLSFFGGVSQSGGAATRSQQTHACRDDALRFCASHIPNKDKIKTCMRQHFDQLSANCQAMFSEPDGGADEKPVDAAASDPIAK